MKERNNMIKTVEKYFKNSEIWENRVPAGKGDEFFEDEE